MMNRILLVALCWFCGAAMTIGEVPLLKGAALEKASEIVVGRVVKVYQRDPVGSGFRHVDFVAELEVIRVEKGSDVKAGEVIYVHYWNQLGQIPDGWTGSRGHDSRCLKENSQVRVYLSLNKKAQREVLLPNGAEPADK